MKSAWSRILGSRFWLAALKRDHVRLGLAMVVSVIASVTLSLRQSLAGENDSLY